MKKVYKEITTFIVSEGKRIAKRAGKIEDIGVKKQFLTEEDLIIERGLKKIIHNYYPKHGFYAEEEHDSFPANEDVWIADPISGTAAFIKNLPGYAIVISHTRKNEVLFSAVYVPSTNKLFTAFKGKGAFLNGKKISVSNKEEKIVFLISLEWKKPEIVEKILEKTKRFQINQNRYGQSSTLCHVAMGDYDGGINLCKDSFPMFALSLIVQEAGGVFTNLKGDSNIHFNDRVFISGNKTVYKKLFEITREILS